MHYSSVYQAFLDTELLLHFAATQTQAFLQVWTSEPTCILGQKDTQLSHFAERCALLAPTPCFVRSSGGQAIISDAGIINLSLFLPEAPSIQKAYDLLYQLIQSYCPLPLHIGEVAHSYCPGSYDLSYQGQKIAGLSQKRWQNQAVVMAYISCQGPQKVRSQRLAQFYNAFPDEKALTVDPKTMTSLEELSVNFQLPFVEEVTQKEVFTSWLQKQKALQTTLAQRLQFRQKGVTSFGKSIS